jgi:Ser/Thr protein kinase RdoA (MazF antagonist)
VEYQTSQAQQKYTELAHRALARYELRVEDITFLQHSENVTYKVSAAGKPYLLRLHLPLTKSMGAPGLNQSGVRSEVTWLDSLRRSKLPVQKSVRNKNGERVTQLRVPGWKPVLCTLLEWLEGDLYSREMETEESVSQIGNLVGKIHKHASKWNLPPGFHRPNRSVSYYLDLVNKLQPAIDDGRINYHDFRTLQLSLEGLAELLRPMRKTKSVFGLIHGDLHRGNFLNHNGEIRLIDFSLCAFGYFVDDLGTCLSNIHPSYHSIFLSNYVQHFHLPENYERLIEGFFIASHVLTFSFWLENPDAQEALVQRVPYIAHEYAARFNRDDRFWFKF